MTGYLLVRMAVTLAAMKTAGLEVWWAGLHRLLNFVWRSWLGMTRIIGNIAHNGGNTNNEAVTSPEV